MPKRKNLHKRLDKTELAWRKLFSKYKILERLKTKDGFVISSKEIRQFREPRLMTKFDHSSDLPEIFRKNKLSILPLSRSKYIIGHFKAYQALAVGDNIKPRRFSLPNTLQTIQEDLINSEALAINAASVSGILNDFLAVNRLEKTIEGRSSTGNFSFQIQNYDGKSETINVENSQMEIDSGFESDDAVILIEAKMFKESDFLVRQLFYPYMAYSMRTTKKIRLVYLTYNDGDFLLTEFKPTGASYNGLVQVKQMAYSIRKETITYIDVASLIESHPIIPEPKVPFPQANSFDRIINMLDFFKSKKVATFQEITEENSFVERQTNYYINAMKYLGLVESLGNGKYSLSQAGKSVSDKRPRDRDLSLIDLILQHEVFRKTLECVFQTGKVPSKEHIVNIMKLSRLYNVTKDKTYFRRSSTVTAWCSWIYQRISADDDE